MDHSNKIQTVEVMEWVGMSKKITEKEIADFLSESKISSKIRKNSI